MTTIDSIHDLSDAALITEAKRLATCERHSTVALIRCLMGLDARRLYLGQGCASLFAYGTRVLRLSEHAAYARIAAARAATRFPVVLDLLEDGAITLTTVTVLAPVLSEENHRAAFEQARHKSKREVEVLAARLRPRPDVPASLRKLPEARPPAAPVPFALGTEASAGWPFMGRLEPRPESPPSESDRGVGPTASSASEAAPAGASGMNHTDEWRYRNMSRRGGLVRGCMNAPCESFRGVTPELNSVRTESSP